MTVDGEYQPDGRFIEYHKVRPFEPRSNGQLDAGGLLRYCETIATHASTAAGFGPDWYQDRGDAWVIFKQTIEIGAPAQNSDLLEVSTWVHSFTRASAIRNYLIRHAQTHAVVARATASWAYVDRATQFPGRIPQSVIEKLPLYRASQALREQRLFGESPEFPQHHITHMRARRYEADSLKHVNNCVYADWLHEASYNAFDDWKNNDLFTFPHQAANLWQRRLYLHYQRSALPGQQITITTTPLRVSSRGIILAHIIADADSATQLVKAETTYLRTLA